MKDKKQLVLNFGHLWLIAMEILVIAGAFGEEGIITTRFYTTDSNVLCFLASIGYLFFRKKNPKAVTLLRFLSTTCLLVTFTVVLTVLGPQKGYADQFLGGMRLFSHLLCPFLSLALFVFGEEKVSYRWSAYAVLITVVYAIPMITLNALGLLSGPYSFLKVREQSPSSTFFWIIVILGGNALLSLGAIKLQHLRIGSQS